MHNPNLRDRAGEDCKESWNGRLSVSLSPPRGRANATTENELLLLEFDPAASLDPSDGNHLTTNMTDRRIRWDAFDYSRKENIDACIGTSSNSREDRFKIGVDAAVLLKSVHDTVNNNVHDCRPGSGSRFPAERAVPLARAHLTNTLSVAWRLYAVVLTENRTSSSR